METYTATFPQKICNATLRIILPSNPEAAFIEGYEQTLGDDDYFPCTIGLSYPCDGLYNFEMGPIRFNSCTRKDDHGHVMIAGDDGMARLPHVIYSQADVQQAFEDIKNSNQFDGYFLPEENWRDVLDYIFCNDPDIRSLPETSEHPVRSFDLHRLGWWS